MSKSMKYIGRAAVAMMGAVLAIVSCASVVQAREDSTAIGTLNRHAIALNPLVKSGVAVQFLDAVKDLPSVKPRIFYYNKDSRKVIDSVDYFSRTDSARAGFAPKEYGDEFYYYTRYGTPLAFVRALDLVCQQGVKSIDGASVIDFGFGSIGQLRLLASLGATAYGIEVDKFLPLLYSTPDDTGVIPRSAVAGQGKSGAVHLLYGSFPTDSAIARQLKGTHDLFISKNTLKRGYIHPEREADPRMLINLGVSDSVFVKSVYDLLKPEGYFMIYNLHPARSKPDEKYIPWSDGRCPFDKSLLETIGFKVIAFDVDDTPFAHEMAKAIGWDKEMDLSKDLFGMYTLVRKL
jgi:hypothetical protein